MIFEACEIADGVCGVKSVVAIVAVAGNVWEDGRSICAIEAEDEDEVLQPSDSTPPGSVVMDPDPGHGAPS